MKNFIVLALLLFVAEIKCQVPFFGGCPKVSVKKDFVPASYLGLWYEQEKYFAIFELGGKCVTANYGAINETTISVTNALINAITGTPTTITGYAQFKGASNEGDLLVTFPSQPATAGSPYQILDTDYTSYAVVHSCTDLFFINFRFLWILTKDRVPSAAVMSKAYSVIDENKLPRAFLLKTSQTGCTNTSSPSS